MLHLQRFKCYINDRNPACFLASGYTSSTDRCRLVGTSAEEKVLVLVLDFVFYSDHFADRIAAVEG